MGVLDLVNAFAIGFHAIHKTWLHLNREGSGKRGIASAVLSHRLAHYGYSDFCRHYAHVGAGRRLLEVTSKGGDWNGAGGGCGIEAEH
jgi:hypothetical protein